MFYKFSELSLSRISQWSKQSICGFRMMGIKYYPVYAMTQANSRRPVNAEAGFALGSVHVGFVVDRVALGHVFSESSSVSPCQYLSTVTLYTRM
jgi:hypothetical protein